MFSLLFVFRSFVIFTGSKVKGNNEDEWKQRRDCGAKTVKEGGSDRESQTKCGEGKNKN